MIANLSPAMSHYQDTYNTLNFAAKSRKIVNKPVVNSVTGNLILAFFSFSFLFFSVLSKSLIYIYIYYYKLLL